MKIPKEFVNSKKRWYLGPLYLGSPYFYPRNFNKNILFIKKLEPNSEQELTELCEKYNYINPKTLRQGHKFKNLQMVRRSKSWIFKLFNNHWFLEIGWPIMIGKVKLGWKDKFQSPRHEWNPQFYIYFFHWQFILWQCSPDGHDERYWEQIIWYLYYHDQYGSTKPDIDKARENWPWFSNDKSTWNNNYLK